MSWRATAGWRSSWVTAAGAILAAAIGTAPTSMMPATARAQERAGFRAHPGDDWVGRWVLAKSRDIVLPDEPRDAAAERFYRYRVAQTAGRRLLLRSEGGETGWAMADQVVPVDQALDYFTRRIRNDPRDAHAYLMRAMSWGARNNPDRMLADLKRAAMLEPENPLVYDLRAVARLHAGEYDAAIAECNRALRLNPQESQAFEVRGLARSGKNDHERAIDDLSRAIQLCPESAQCHVNRGTVWNAAGDTNKAILDLTTAIRLDPENTLAYTIRGTIWGSRGKYESAITDYDQAIRLDSKNVNAYSHRSYAWLSLGKLDAALVDSETALRLDPASAVAYLTRGRIGQLRGKPAAALVDYDEVIRLDPTMAVAHNNAAWIRATCPNARLRDGQKAVASATRACELTKWQDAAFLDTMAAASAEAGDFDAAVKWQAKAIAMWPDGPEKTEGEAHLKLYRDRKPYHRPGP